MKTNYQLTSGQSQLLLGILILLFDIITTYNTVMSSRSLAFKFVWTLLMCVFPFEGFIICLPLYLYYSLSDKFTIYS
ncbi:hypothetical protein AB4K20DRAFT_1907785 [Rhizopus microsporus]